MLLYSDRLKKIFQSVTYRTYGNDNYNNETLQHLPRIKH